MTYAEMHGPTLRVLMISDVYFPRINGVSTSIQTFRTALLRHGVQVTLVAPDYPGDPHDEQVIRLPASAVPLDPEDRLMSLRALYRLDRRLTSADFDVVHVQTPFAAHYAGQRFARLRTLPCITTYHTHFEEYLFHYIPVVPRPWLKGAARALARHQCNALDAVVVPSAPMATTLRDYGVTSPLHVIPTGLPDSAFVHGNGQHFRLRHGIAPSRKLALFVGRTAHEKNIDFLLHMIDAARMHDPEVMLVIAGEGPALQGLESRAEALGLAAHTRFVGYLDRNTELRDCYAAADVFVFASHTETQGLVLLEAMASGVPVLAIAELGTRSIVEPGRGALVAETTPAGFARQLLGLLADQSRLARMGAEGIRFAHEWGADQPARQLAQLYRSLAGHPATCSDLTLNSATLRQEISR